MIVSRILPALLITIAIGIFMGYTNPTYTNEILPLKAQIKEYTKALAAADEFKKKEAQLANERNAIPADSIARLQSFLPDGVDNIQMIIDMNALAARSGVELSNVDVSSSAGRGPANSSSKSSGQLPLSGAAPVQSLDFSLNVTGTYSAFRTYLNALEKSLRPIDISSISLGVSQTGVYTYTLGARIYWLQ